MFITCPDTLESVLYTTLSLLCGCPTGCITRLAHPSIRLSCTGLVLEAKKHEKVRIDVDVLHGTYTGWPKKLAQFFVRLNFTKY